MVTDMAWCAFRSLSAPPLPCLRSDQWSPHWQAHYASARGHCGSGVMRFMANSQHCVSSDYCRHMDLYCWLTSSSGSLLRLLQDSSRRVPGRLVEVQLLLTTCWMTLSGKDSFDALSWQPATSPWSGSILLTLPRL